MSDLDVAELARDLQKASANLKRHIADEAAKRAAELGKVYAKAADERIKAKDLELQRASDLLGELKRQIVVLDRRSATLGALEKLLKELLWEAHQRDTDIPVQVLSDAIKTAQEAGRAAPARWADAGG